MTRMTSTKALVSNSMPSAQHWLNCSPRNQDRSQGAESGLSKTIASPNRQKNRPLPFYFIISKIASPHSDLGQRMIYVSTSGESNSMFAHRLGACVIIYYLSSVIYYLFLLTSYINSYLRILSKSGSGEPSPVTTFLQISDFIHQTSAIFPPSMLGLCYLSESDLTS